MTLIKNRTNNKSITNNITNNIMTKASNFYRTVSIIKIILGLTTTLLTYYNININEDPWIAIGLGFFWLFIFLWGLSFFIFYGILYFTSSEELSLLRIQKDSYKSSFLFGMYAMINILLIVLVKRTKLLGIVILAIFILLHVILFSGKRND